MVTPGACFVPAAAALTAGWAGAAERRAFPAARALALASLALPAPAALAAAALAAWLGRRDRARWDLAVPALLLAAFRARLRWMPSLPGSLGAWLAVGALVLVIAASQRLLAAEDGEEADAALGHGQAAWMLFAFLSPAPLAWAGGLLLLWQQPLLRQPLGRLLQAAPGRAVLAGLLFLGLAGGPLLSAFNAYFQVLAPLMTENAAVVSMQSKLFTGTGLLAVLAILALLYQTGAFGYFYWSRVLPAAPMKGSATEHWRPVPQPWAWACLGASLAWGVAEHWGLPGRLALQALRALGAVPVS